MSWGLEWTLLAAGVGVGGAVVIGGRDHLGRGLSVVLVATSLHALLLASAGVLAGWFGWEEPVPAVREIYEVAVVEPEAPEPEPPDPKPKPEPEPEPEPEKPPPEREPPKTAEPERPPKPEPKRAPKTDPRPASESAPPKMFDLSNTTAAGASGVVVQTGTGGEYGSRGRAESSSARGPAGGGTPEADEPGVGSWSPRGELFVERLPRPVTVPEIECPATAETGVEGDVVLKVQVRSDGRVRKVTVVRGIGSGCDRIARDALRKAKFKPAIATDGEPVDFELRYEYAFRVVN